MYMWDYVSMHLFDRGSEYVCAYIYVQKPKVADTKGRRHQRSPPPKVAALPSTAYHYGPIGS